MLLGQYIFIYLANNCDHYSIFTFSNHKTTPNITKAITRREFSEQNVANVFSKPVPIIGFV